MSSHAGVPARILRAVVTTPRGEARCLPERIGPRGSVQPALRPSRARTPIELTAEVLRGPFRPLIVWGLFWGPRPFSELMRHVPDVTKRALRRELVEMERIGLVIRDVRPDSNRRAFYALSPFGETLRPVVGAMYEWGLLCAEPRRLRDARSG
jgi:DNA-binding HxlR family transcriptional regulator